MARKKPGNQNQTGVKHPGGNGKSDTNAGRKTSNSEKIDFSNEQINALSAQASEQLTEEDLETLDSSPPESFDLKQLWKKAEIFDVATKSLELENQKLESQKQELKVKQTDLEDQKQKLTEASKLLREDREQLNGQLAEVNQQERQFQEREANATAGFLTQNRVALSQLEQQIAQVSQEIAQALSKKVEIQEQLTEEIAHKYAEFEQKIFTERQELDQERQQLIADRKPLRKEQNRLEIDRELLDEERQYFEEKVEQRAAAKIAKLEIDIAIREQLYKNSEQRLKELATKYANLVDANRLFKDRNPEEILAELEDLRRRNNELDQKLSERPTEAAARRLEDLEVQKEQWEAEGFRLSEKVQQLERSAAINRIAVLNLETLRDEKEALEASNNRLRAVLEELRVNVNDAIAQSKERSPFEKCVQLDKDENLQIAPPLSQESIDLAQFAEDLRYRIAISPLEKGKRLYYSEQDIRAFLGGIAMSKLHILQGISGTGKTSLPIAFARALGRRGRENYKLVEVQAGWRDRQDLIGYYNSFEGKFYETEFLTALYEAQCPEFRDQIYIIILDEMNLSRPEQYFADFLSKLEQDAPELILNTDLERPSPKLFNKKDTLSIPPNVWLVGTANQDETTLEFADKTYDRAHVMELERSQESFDIPPKLSPRYPISYKALTTAFNEAQKQHQSKATEAFDFLNCYLSERLESKFKIGWGNRLQRQINDYIPVVIAAGGSLTEATDHILATKILRKVRDRHDIQSEDLTELKKTIETLWSELGTEKPVKSLNLLQSELQRLERGTY
ncbi:hypothetical protein QT971_10325 [Microcoleus sp. herbarium19]|uniref:hypothetical protein n=1 Tax=Microcoleus sp. herbarium19 TaxID=3055440 RepID=UPI002FD41A40